MVLWLQLPKHKNECNFNQDRNKYIKCKDDKIDKVCAKTELSLKIPGQRNLQKF